MFAIRVNSAVKKMGHITQMHHALAETGHNDFKRGSGQKGAGQSSSLANAQADQCFVDRKIALTDFLVTFINIVIY